jgi:hypothetical protein
MPRRTIERMIVRLLGVIVMGFLAAWALGVRVVPDPVNCNVRNTTIPEAPVYPDSVLVRKAVIFDVSEYSVYEYTYETTGSYEDIVEYYAAAGCTPYDWLVCKGSASPFGDYELYIVDEPLSDAITYRLVVEWDKCPPGWKEYFIEDW